MGLMLGQREKYSLINNINPYENSMYVVRILWQFINE